MSRDKCNLAGETDQIALDRPAMLLKVFDGGIAVQPVEILPANP